MNANSEDKSTEKFGLKNSKINGPSVGIMPNRHVDYNKKKYQKIPSPYASSSKWKNKGPISTSTRQSTAYVTVKGIESETSYPERDWPIFALKELLDNAYDFLNDYYPNESKEARKIAVCVKIESYSTIPAMGTSTEKVESCVIRITVRNSNINNIGVFENLQQIFDYDTWYSSKRNQHRMTCGSLGDFLKRVLGMGFASWTGNYNPHDSFQDRQWEEPLILRFNGNEVKTFIKVDRDRSTIESDINEPTLFDAPNFTEVDITLPVHEYWNQHELEKGGYKALLNKLENYYKNYRIAKKSRTDFSFCKEEWKK